MLGVVTNTGQLAERHAWDLGLETAARSIRTVELQQITVEQDASQALDHATRFLRLSQAKASQRPVQLLPEKHHPVQLLHAKHRPVQLQHVKHRPLGAQALLQALDHLKRPQSCHHLPRILLRTVL